MRTLCSEFWINEQSDFIRSCVAVAVSLWIWVVIFTVLVGRLHSWKLRGCLVCAHLSPAKSLALLASQKIGERFPRLRFCQLIGAKEGGKAEAGLACQLFGSNPNATTRLVNDQFFGRASHGSKPNNPYILVLHVCLGGVLLHGFFCKKTPHDISFCVLRYCSDFGWQSYVLIDWNIIKWMWSINSWEGRCWTCLVRFWKYRS